MQATIITEIDHNDTLLELWRSCDVTLPAPETNRTKHGELAAGVYTFDPGRAEPYCAGAQM